MKYINEVRKELYTQLSTVSTTYEYKRVPDNATLPYIVYEVRNSTKNLNRQNDDKNYELMIGIYDYQESKDTTTINTLMINVENLLQNAVFYTDNTWIQFKYGRVLTNLPTDNEYTFRREFYYTVEVNERTD